MQQTTPDGLRYPDDSDTPDIPRDFKNLADDTQAALLNIARPLVGPVAERPSVLEPGQIFYGY